VASDIDGFRAVAANAAALVRPGDPGALAHGLREVLSDGARRREMAKMGKRLASMYDWSRLAANVETTYERALAAARV
jgi:glycosyltransferase involved in cell wall biosynthesis